MKVSCEIRRGTEDEIKVFGLSSWNNGVAIYCREPTEKNTFRAGGGDWEIGFKSAKVEMFILCRCRYGLSSRV